MYTLYHDTVSVCFVKGNTTIVQIESINENKHMACIQMNIFQFNMYI